MLPGIEPGALPLPKVCSDQHELQQRTGIFRIVLSIVLEWPRFGFIHYEAGRVSGSSITKLSDHSYEVWMHPDLDDVRIITRISFKTCQTSW
jgi:hypothetical protein